MWRWTQLWRLCNKSQRKNTEGSDEFDIESNKKTEERSRKNMRMMSNCVREIQAPVSDLCGLKSIMQDIPEGSSIYHYTKCMNTCGILLADMIQNMRLYYILSSDLYESEKSLFVLRTELEFVWESLIDDQKLLDKFSEHSSHLHFGDITFTLNFGEDVPSGLVESDSTCVLKIFKSLLENAIRFTLEGKIIAEVYLIITEDTKGKNNAVLHMVVTDTGVGVPDEAREAIFEPLTKSHVESIHGGVGMGLPVSRAMCENLGGSLVLEDNISPKNVGCTFHACFPLSMSGWNPGGVLTKTKVMERRKVAKRKRSFSASMISDWTEDEPREMPQVLLVEDVKLNRTIVSHMIGEVGIIPECAEDGVIAVEACRTKKYDVILMDITMPNMGGIEATKEIKKNCLLNQETPIIALTGTLAGQMETFCLQAGMVQCLAKPVKRRQLVEYISANVERKHQVWMASK